MSRIKGWTKLGEDGSGHRGTKVISWEYDDERINAMTTIEQNRVFHDAPWEVKLRVGPEIKARMHTSTLEDAKKYAHQFMRMMK